MNLISEWYGCTPETEGVTPEEFDRKVRVIKQQLKEFNERKSLNDVLS